MIRNPFQKWAAAQLERMERRKKEPYGRITRIIAGVLGAVFFAVFLYALWFAHEAPDFYILYIPVVLGSGLVALEFLLIAIRGKDSGGWAIWP